MNILNVWCRMKVRLNKCADKLINFDAESYLLKLDQQLNKK